MKTRIVLSIFSSTLLSSFVSAQCNIEIDNFTVTTNCYEPAFASLNVSGGTPPYTLSFETESLIETTWPSQNGGYLSGLVNSNEFDSHMTLTVTDALNCSVTTAIDFVRHVVIFPELGVTGDCSNGIMIHWSGKYLYGNSVIYSNCGGSGPFNYLITGYGSSFSASGSVNNDWIQDPDGSWRYPVALPADNYLVDIVPSFMPPPLLTCPFGNPIECFAPALFSATIDPGDCGTNFRLRAALAGALPSGTVMTDELRSIGVIPLVEPYTETGYDYVGTSPGVSIPASMLTALGNNSIVDWIVVEVRETNAPYAVLHSRPALLQRDGDVVDTDGSTYINAPLTPGNYRIALRHRNHLGVMSGLRSLSLSPTSTLIDFRSTSTSVYGTNSRLAVGSVQCLWPGDGDGNGTVQYTGSGNDRDFILSAIGGVIPTSSVTNVYNSLDLNMDGTIRYTGTNNDRDIILETIGGVVPTATRVEQVP